MRRLSLPNIKAYYVATKRIKLMDQKRETKNRPTQTCTTTFDQDTQEFSEGKAAFSQVLLEQPGVHCRKMNVTLDLML